MPAWKLRLGSSFRHRLGILLAAISLFVGTYWTIRTIALAYGDTAYKLLFLCLALVITLASSLLVYGVIRAIGWVVVDFATSYFWRKKIKRSRRCPVHRQR